MGDDIFDICCACGDCCGSCDCDCSTCSDCDCDCDSCDCLSCHYGSCCTCNDGGCCHGCSLCRTLCLCHMCDCLWDSCYYVHTDTTVTGNANDGRRRRRRERVTQSYATTQPPSQAQPLNPTAPVQTQPGDQKKQQAPPDQPGSFNGDTITTQPASLPDVPLAFEEAPPPSYEEAVSNSNTATDKV